MKRRRDGFTLLELVIVISIIAILLAIAIPKFSKSNLSAQAAAHNGNVRILQNAAILYLADHPNAETVSAENLKDYIEGKLPKPAKGLSATSFEIHYSNGDVKIVPGMVKVEGNQLVPEHNSDG
ncbi:MAG: prepilin-type N-terminal cleavage/methylation domain-containing protein [Tissierellia bacterium]|nr:prepilin-type N-terminal cleavage/methylation domain-containing protein [Tissierellia bacterium]